MDRGDGQPYSESFLAHAARAFFLNGGQRLYVSRVFAPRDPGGGAPADFGLASLPLAFGAGDAATWRARWPGALRQRVLTVRPVRKRNGAVQHPTFGTQATGLTRGAVVEIVEPPVPPATLPGDQDDLVPANLAVVDLDDTVVDANGRPQQVFRGAAARSPPPPPRSSRRWCCG